MKRAKMNVIIAAFIIVAYIAAASITTYSSFATHTASFNSTAFSVSEELAQRKMDILVGNEEGDITLEELCSLYSLSGYPYVIGIYDSEGRLVAHTQTYASVITGDDKKYIINIDEYITDEVKRQIQDYAHRCLTNVDLLKLDYAEVDGKYVPVNLYFQKNGVYGEYKKFNITDYKISGSFYSDTQEIIPKNELKGSQSANIECAFYNFFENRTNEKIMNKMLDGLTSDSVMKYVNKCNGDYEGDFGEWGAAYSAWMTDGGWSINGEDYTLHWESRFNPLNEVWNTVSYNELIRAISLVFIVLSVLIFTTFNIYFTRRKRLDDARNAFVSAAAHELKTPIAAIQGNCECIIENIAPDKNEKYLATIHSESERMSRLVATLLQYNRLAMSSSVRKEPCSLTQIVNNELEAYAPLISERGIMLEKHIAEDAEIVANEELISLAVDNFLSNAVKHTGENGAIRVTLEKHKKGYRLSVFNEGSSIDKEYADKLWDIFYRTDKARNSADKSSGMGLAICKQIFEHHGCKYGFFSKENGVEFYFTI